MRLKYKLLLTMVGMSLFLFAFSAISSLNTIYGEMHDDKHTMLSALLTQDLRSFENAADEVAFYYFDICKTEGIGNIMALEKSIVKKRVQLQMKLRNIISNSTNYIEDACIVDSDEVFYFSPLSSLADRQTFQNIYEQSVRSSDRDVIWISENGNQVYLCRTIYTMVPYQPRGYLLGRLNMDSLRSRSGMEMAEKGTVLVLRNNQNVLFASEELTSLIQWQTYISATANAADIWSEHSTGSQPLHIYRTHTKSNDWGIMMIIPENSMMHTYQIIQQKVISAHGLMIALSILLSLFFSRTMTRNIQHLIHSINHVHENTTKGLIEVKGHDEIAELANKYNGLLSYINEIHQAEYDLLELKYRFIQAQISPHFMSNILSSIASYSIMGNSIQVEDLCIKTSHYLRNNLVIGDRRFIRIDEELKNVQEYIEIYQMISSVEVHFQRDCPQELEEMNILSMLLQPLVENALLYAANPYAGSEQLIGIRVCRQEDRLCVEVYDNGCGMDPEVLSRIENIKKDVPDGALSPGFGIGAVIRRLHLQYKRDYTFDVLTQKNQGTRIFISFPLDPC